MKFRLSICGVVLVLCSQVMQSGGNFRTHERIIAPAVTDSCIDNWLEGHCVIYPETQARNTLFLFFTASLSNPGDIKRLQNLLASHGYQTIDLRYPNSWTTPGLCGQSEDPDCFEKFRLEILDGIDRSDKVSISPANSVYNRTVKLLRYLNNNYPDEGWNKYFINDSISWNKVIVAGVSQGAGLAAILGKQKAVKRVLMFSGPNDFSDRYNATAPWLAKTGETSPSNYYGFGHLRDGYWNSFTHCWNELGITSIGGLKEIGKGQKANHSHALYSNLEIFNNDFHGSSCIDGATPLFVTDELLYNDIFNYMVDGGTGSSWLKPKFKKIDWNSNGQVHLEWSSGNLLADGFIIEEKDGSEADWRILDTLNITENNYYHNCPSAVTTIQYRLYAYCDTGTSDTVQTQEFVTEERSNIKNRGGEIYTLLPNSPNPFNSSTRINYMLAGRCHVKIDISNILGQEVESIFNGEQSEGSHSIYWDAAKFPSGIYFVSLIADSFRGQQKILLQK